MRSLFLLELGSQHFGVQMTDLPPPQDFEPYPLLPARPIPLLDQSLAHVMESAAPFLNNLGKMKTRGFLQIIKQLLSQSQSNLQLIAEKEAWTEVCMRDFYLCNRQSLSFYSNVFYLFQDHPECLNGLDRAACLIAGCLEFYREYQNKQFKPSNEGESLVDLSQFGNLFSAARIPQKGKDQTKKWTDQNHIIILIHGQFYQIELEEPLIKSPLPRIRTTLQAIVEDSHRSYREPPLGILTSLPRNSWSESYLNQSEKFDRINRAILVIALDLHEFPATRTEMMWLISHGNPENRWYDKSHQIIVTGNGKAGINRDHTSVDGATCGRYLSEIFQRAIHIRKTETPPVSSPEPYPFEKIKWSCTKSVQLAISQAFRFCEKEVQKRNISTFDICFFGKELCTKKSLSADAVVQLAIQLGVYLHFGRLMSVNEAVNMLHFHHGRYDTIWCVTPESKKFIEAITQNYQIKDPEPSQKIKIRETLISAVSAHRKKIKECKLGKSAVSHLTALIGMQPENRGLAVDSSGLQIFKKWVWRDPGFSKLMNSDITTSDPGSRLGFELSGFTDTSPGVIGIAYQVAPEKVKFYLKTDHQYLQDSKGIEQNLLSAFERIHEILSKIDSSVLKCAL